MLQIGNDFNLILEKRSVELIHDIERNLHIKKTLSELNNNDKFLRKELRKLDNIEEMMLLNKLYLEDLDKFDELNHRNKSLLIEKNKTENDYKSTLIKMDELNSKILDIKSKLKKIENLMRKISFLPLNRKKMSIGLLLLILLLLGGILRFYDITAPPFVGDETISTMVAMIELLPGVPLQFGADGLRWQSGLVGSLSGHGVVGIH